MNLIVIFLPQKIILHPFFELQKTEKQQVKCLQKYY